jgi:hypothetical protein
MFDDEFKAHAIETNDVEETFVPRTLFPWDRISIPFTPYQSSL